MKTPTSISMLFILTKFTVSDPTKQSRRRVGVLMDMFQVLTLLKCVEGEKKHLDAAPIKNMFSPGGGVLESPARETPPCTPSRGAGFATGPCS